MLIASSSILLTKIESGVVLIFHFTTIPSKQSIIGDKYTFPAGMANSVISVNHFVLGAKKIFQKTFTAQAMTKQTEQVYLDLMK